MSTSPCKEEWRVGPDTDAEVVDASGERVATMSGEGEVRWMRAVFVAGGPRMARVLMEFVEGREDVETTRMRAREALEEAGVPL